MSRISDPFPIHAHGEDDNGDDWGSDFEGELCSQEIEDNKINEIREANLLKNSTNNVQDLNGDDSQTVLAVTGSRCVNDTKTGAIPKSGFSYLNHTSVADAKRSIQTHGKKSRNSDHSERLMSQPASESRNATMNSENLERQSQTQEPSNKDPVTKMTPRKLKPEAFSFLNKVPQRNIRENGVDVVVKERKTLAPTAFAHAGKLAFSQSPDNTSQTLDESSKELVKEIPSTLPLEKTTSNYESIPEDSLSEFVLPPPSSNIVKENLKPPLPSRPPPVFKYPPETFLSSRSASIESTANLDIHPLPQTYPKLSHSISSPDSGIKNTSEEMPDGISTGKAKQRRSLPSATNYPAVPKRPLPPLPVSATENVSRIKSQSGTNLLENTSSINNESWLEEAPTINGAISSRQTNQLSVCERPTQHTALNEQALQEQLISNPQHKLAQILTNQTSVDSTAMLLQQKIASAITARATASENSSLSRLHLTQKSEFQNSARPHEINRLIPGRSSENDADETNEDDLELQPPYLEAKDAINPRRFADPETLINAMNRPMLPQKAAPIQRSVSCNSLVQSIKDLSFSVWSKPEKKRNSDGIGLTKKNHRSISVASQSKIKCTAPISITLIPTDSPSEVIHTDRRKSDASPIDENSTLQQYPWFHDVDAKEGQLRLLSVGLDGTFLVRPSSRPTDDIQNTLCILYNRKIRNLHIRKLADGRYVLGTKSNKNFSSLAELIRHHKEIPVEILPQGSTPIKPQLYRILLTETPPKLKKLFTVV